MDVSRSLNASPDDLGQDGQRVDRRRALLESVTVAVVAALVAGAGVLGLWLSAVETIRDNYLGYVTGVARIGAVLVDPVLHDSIRDPAQLNGPEYLRAVEPLRLLRKALPDVRYIYTLVRDGKDVRYVLDAADPGTLSETGIADQSQVWERVVDPHQDQAMTLSLGDGVHPGVPAANRRSIADKWGVFISGFAPLIDARGRQFGTLGVDIRSDLYLRRMAAARRHALLGLIPALLMIALLAGWYFRIRLRMLEAARHSRAIGRELLDAAQRDRLTGLANRSQFMEALQATVDRVREGRQGNHAVLFLDFDRFKLVNDALGHAAGDGLLREIAQRLQHSLHRIEPRLATAGASLVARFGGDEFLVLMNDVDAQQAQAIAERLLMILSQAYTVDGREVNSSASIGIVASSQGTECAEAVVRNADIAMYEAKRSGRACAMMFNEAMRTRLTRHVTVEGGLRKALGTRELSLVYQPIVELKSGRMVSVEALCRWHSPQLGEVSPSEFIPVAEESGLIISLGQWVLQEACGQLARWRRLDPQRAPAVVSVNVSRAELGLGERLLARVRTVLEETGLAASCLQLEVTEREVMRDPEGTLALMRQLRELGVRFAMDDFGTGTSSLGCLRDYPFDVIKIDRSFIQDIIASADVLAVIHATVTLVKNLGRTSIAEGVEHGEQVAVLQALGCHYAQGWFFSHPMTAPEMHGYMVGSGKAGVVDSAQAAAVPSYHAEGR